MADLASLQVQLELQTAAFERGVKRMDGQLKKMEKNTKRSSRQMDKLAKALKKAGVAAVAFAGAAAAAFTAQQARAAIAYGDAVAKTADKVGVTVEELQELRFAAEQSGVGTASLDMALQRFARRMGEAAKGTGELAKTAKELGIEFENADGSMQSTSQLLEQYADAIGRADTQQEKLRLTFKAFDSEGAALVNLLRDGSAEMKELSKQAADLGIVLDEDTARSAEIINDKLNIIAQTASVSVKSAFIDAAAAVANFFDIATDVESAQIIIERLEKEIERKKDFAANVQIEGSFGQKLSLKEITELEEKLAEAQQIVNESLERRKKIEEQLDPSNLAPPPDAGKDWIAFAEGIRASLDPMIAYQKQVDDIKAAFVGGFLGLEEAAEAIALIAKEAYYALDPLGQLEKKAMDLALALNPLNEKAAQLGVLYKALEMASDPASVEQLMDAIWELENTDLKPPDDMADKWTSAFEEIKDAVNGFTKDFTNKLVDGLIEGELAFDDFAKSVLATIAKMMLNRVFTQFFDLILNSFGLGTSPTGSGANPQADVTRSVVDPMARAGASVVQPMLSSPMRGGMPSMNSGSPVTVNVVNNGKDDVEVQERQTSRGVEIDVLIKQAVNRGISSGDFDNSMRAAFGSRRMAY